MTKKRDIAGKSWWIAVAAAMLLTGLTANAPAQRDRGVNQPGAVGNAGGGRDAGFNQPGRAGNNGAVGGRPARPAPSPTLDSTSPAG